MDSNIKTLLIILAFVVITIIVFKPFHSCDTHSSNARLSSRSNSEAEEERECYNPSLDSKYINPRVSPYSKSITFRPDADNVYELDDPANSDPDKLLDHLSDQNRGPNEFDNNIDTDPKNNINNQEKQLMRMRLRQQHQNRSNQGLSNQGLHEYKGSAGSGSTFYPMMSTYPDTEIDSDIVRESNNIARYCVNSQPDTGMMIDDKGTVLPDGVDRPYSAIIDDISEMNMNMDNKQYYDLISNRPEHKTYIQIDENFGRFNQNVGDGKIKDVNGLADITSVMDTYRNNTMYSINSAYKNAESGKRMYDTVN